MRLYVVTEKQFQRDAAGALVTDNVSSTGYRFWSRYLSAFEEVRVVARVKTGAASTGGAVEGPGVQVLPVLPFGSLRGLLRALPALRRTFQSLAAPSEPTAYLVRAPTTFGALLLRSLRRRGLPYGLEIIGDPHDVLAPGALRHPLRPLLRWWSARELRRQVGSAAAVAYVTSRHLQLRYPAGPGAVTASYSSLELPSTAFGAERRWAARPDPLRLVFVGTLSQLYKAPDVLLEAVAGLHRRGRRFALDVLGGGQHLEPLRARAAALGLGGSVCFRGQVPSGTAVLQALDAADVFVLPSRTEGLPRAMLEAMARGLPCVGTAVGGIPELLGPEELVPPGDAAALASKLLEVGEDPARLERLSRDNLATARGYEASLLAARRAALYAGLRREAERRWALDGAGTRSGERDA